MFCALTGRGRKGYLMAIPLIIGFKIASAVVAAMSALKVLVVKTVLVSGLALIAAAALTAKYVYEKIMMQHQAVQSPPYHFGHQQKTQVTWEPFYETPGGLSDFQQDLQGQYSNPLDDSTSTDKHNASAFGYINLAVERKSLPYRPPQLFKTTVYKSTVN
ncbi:uncharacterized protein isoform X4 [Rhodnius prolixus]|uniref:uncharacterized protein isoform X4 n=1 Tax=Rhodnius prolixus TaxID=13249 RepID=UPI003D189D40